MGNWEDILTGYLEGNQSRADAEALRWKIHLPAEVREEVEAVLRQVDEVAAAVGSVAVPEGAVERLRGSLHGQPDWTGRPVPAGWRRGPEGFEATALAAGRLGQEDAVNALIEGTEAMAESTGLAANRTPADEELAGRLEQVRSITSHLSDLARQSPPPGAVDRLLSRFREDVTAGAGGDEEGAEGAAEADEEAARQFLAKLKTNVSRRPALPPRPDVLAASADHAEPEAVSEADAPVAGEDRPAPPEGPGRSSPGDPN